ncbi:MAG: hypothetical protein ABFR75_06570 [Acidobacteriota bacterium]
MKKFSVYLFILIFLITTATITGQTMQQQSSSAVKKKKKIVFSNVKLSVPTEVKTGNMLGAVGATITVKAILTTKVKKKPLVRKTLKFYIGGKFVNQAYTAANGKAQVQYKVPNEIGPKEILVKFDGVSGYLKSSGKAKLGIIKSSSKLSIEFLNPNFEKKPGHTVNISGRLYRITDNKGLNGRKVRLLLNNSEIQNVATNTHGKYKVNYTIPNNASGNLTFRTRFSGDKLYLGSESPKLSRQIFAPLKNGYLHWNSAQGKVGQKITIKASFRSSAVPFGNNGIPGRKIRLRYRYPGTADDYKILGSGVTNSSGVANISFRIEHAACNSHIKAMVVPYTLNGYKVIKLKTSAGYKVSKSPVSISIMGSNSVKVGTTVLFTVIVHRTTDNSGAGDVMVTFANKMKKKTSHLGSAGFFYKIPAGPLGNRKLIVTSGATDKYLAGAGSKTINVLPNDS